MLTGMLSGVLKGTYRLATYINYIIVNRSATEMVHFIKFNMPFYLTGLNIHKMVHKRIVKQRFTTLLSYWYKPAI